GDERLGRLGQREQRDAGRIVHVLVQDRCETARLELRDERGRVRSTAERVKLHVQAPIEPRRLAVRPPPVLRDVDALEPRLLRPLVDARPHPPCSHAAASFAWYVTTRSAPARRIPVSASSTTARSSSQPFAAPAFTIAYSPLTL